MRKAKIPQIKLDGAKVHLIETKVLEMWERRAKAQGYSKKSSKAKELQAEFLLGMVAALDAINKNHELSSMSPRIFFSVMRGDYVE